MSLPIQPEILDAWPFTAASVGYAKNLTDTDANISLPVGGYEITLVSDSSAGAFGCLGATAAPPSTGAHANGFFMLPGTTYSLFVQTAAALHGIMIASSATGTLYITKVR